MCVADKDDSDQCDADALNPINLSRGEKKQTFVDFQQRIPLPLTYTRSYRSLRTPSAQNKIASVASGSSWKKYFQPTNFTGYSAYSGATFQEDAQGYLQWRHNYQYKLHSFNGGKKIIIHLPNGQNEKFTQIYSSHYATVKRGSFLRKQTDGTWLYIDSNNLHHTFSSEGLLSSIEDANGYSLSFTYDQGNKLETVTNQSGQVITYQYDALDRIEKVFLPTGNEILHSYDSLNNLVGVLHVSSSSPEVYEQETYHYEDANHPNALTGITDSNGIRSATWTYNEHGQAVNSSHALGTDVGSVSYDQTNHTATVVDASNKTKTVTFNSYGRINDVVGESCSTAGQDSQVSFSYDSLGRVTQKVQAEGATETFSYDANGFLKDHILAAGSSLEHKTS